MGSNKPSIVDVIDASASRFPMKPMVEAGGEVWTYAAVMDASHREAAALNERGVGKGDRVAIMGLNCPEYLVAAIAVWRVGAVLVPVNHKLTSAECGYILNHSNARLTYASAELEDVVREANGGAQICRLEAITKGDDGARSPRFAAPDISENDPAEILYTSGTTGKPKGCMHTHRGLVSVAMLSAIAMSVVPRDRTLIAMPIWHAAPLNNFCLPTLYVGGTLVLLREYEPEAFLRTMSDAAVTVYFGSPVSYTLPLSRPGGTDEFDFSQVRALFYGGGPISAELSRRLAAAYRTDRFHQVYGMTETGPGGTMLYPEEQKAKAGSIGRASQPGAMLRLLTDGRDATAGEVGEIWLHCPGLMEGYLDDPEATAEVIVDGWYRTGDLARIDEDGYLFIVDRAKDMVVTGGENVYSKEVEDALGSLPEIADCAVIGLPHEEWGETVVAAIIPAVASVDEAALRQGLAKQLAAYKVPRRFLAVDELPRTPTGKIQKHILRAMFTASPSLQQSEV